MTHYGHNIDITERPAYCSDCEEFFNVESPDRNPSTLTSSPMRLITCLGCETEFMSQARKGAYHSEGCRLRAVRAREKAKREARKQ